MECNKDEAVRAKKIAENKMTNNDFEGARKIALKAQKLYPELDNISQLLAVCDVHCSAQKKINGADMDLYGILQVESFADEATIRKQYRKLALVLHPDKNQFPGAEAAFKLIGEANLILFDKQKRYLHDLKCRDPSRFTVPKPQNHQENQSSNAGMQFAARSKYYNGTNHQQQAQTGSNGQPSFWTFCPFCKVNYEYYRDLVNKSLKCPKCSKLFIAIDIGVHRPAQNVNQGSNMGRPASQQENAEKQGNSKVDAPRAGQSFSNLAGANTVETGNIKTEGGKKGVASKETRGKSSVECDKRSCKRPKVSYSEEAVDDSSPGKRCRVRKISSDVEDKQKESTDMIIDKDKLKGEDVIPGSNSKSNTETEDNSEPVFFDVLELQFSNFDQDKEEHCFAVDQIWACYDTVDSMPRFYAQIRKVFSSEFRVRITWLEADPENDLEKIWVEEGLPVACGKFVRGGTEETRDRLMFSHQIAYKKGIQKVKKGNTRPFYVIHPKKCEIWALFKDWDIKWGFDPPKSHTKYKFEIVEVLDDFDNDNGVLVAYMVKVEGFVSLFQKTSRARLAEHRVPSSELFRFSHRIPSVKLTGTERADVPVGSCELDTASLPDDLDEYYFSNNVKVKPENVSDQTRVSCPQSPEAKVKPLSDREMFNLRRSPRGSKGNLEQSTFVEDSDKGNIATPSKSTDPSCHNNDVNTSTNSFTKEPEFIHDFNLDKQNWTFLKGQIWAVGGIKNGNLYAQIKKVENFPLRLHVDLLESCIIPINNMIRPIACGLFKASSGGRQIFFQDSFKYLVKAEVNGKNRFNIYPRDKEIWVLCNKQDSMCTFSDLDAGDCDIVEVLENNRDIIKVLSLSRLPGCKSVFRAVESSKSKVLEIPLAESNRFFCRINAFLLTEEQDGRFRGSWELDLTEFPGLLPS